MHRCIDGRVPAEHRCFERGKARSRLDAEFVRESLAAARRSPVPPLAGPRDNSQARGSPSGPRAMVLPARVVPASRDTRSVPSPVHGSLVGELLLRLEISPRRIASTMPGSQSATSWRGSPRRRPVPSDTHRQRDRAPPEAQSTRASDTSLSNRTASIVGVDAQAVSAASVRITSPAGRALIRATELRPARPRRGRWPRHQPRPTRAVTSRWCGARSRRQKQFARAVRAMPNRYRVAPAP